MYRLLLRVYGRRLYTLLLIMKKSLKITLSGIMAALGTAVMFLSFFPYATFSVPAVASFAVMLVLLEVGIPYSIGTYIVIGVLSLLLCEKEASLYFVTLMGLYPVIKALCERVKSRVVEWVLKMLYLNAAVGVSYLVLTYIMGIKIEETSKFSFMLIITLLLGNIAFVLYDRCLSSLADFYFRKIHKSVAKILKK